MKKNYIVYLILLMSVLLVRCKKDDGPIPKSVLVERVPAPLLIKDATSSPAIDVLNLANFSAKVTISLYFPNDILPSKLDIVIRKNDVNGNVRVFKADVRALPLSITVSAAELATLFGTPVVLGDTYDISVDMYAHSGKKYEAFPLVGAGYATGFQPDHPGFNTVVRYAAICAYNSALFTTGLYSVVKDEWGDYAVGEVTTVTQIDATHLSFNYKPEVGSQPIIVAIDPLTNITSVVKQTYGNYPSFNPYGIMSVNTAPSNNNIVAPCDKAFGVYLDHTVSIGSYGKYLIKFRKL